MNTSVYSIWKTIISCWLQQAMLRYLHLDIWWIQLCLTRKSRIKSIRMLNFCWPFRLLPANTLGGLLPLVLLMYLMFKRFIPGCKILTKYLATNKTITCVRSLNMLTIRNAVCRQLITWHNRKKKNANLVVSHCNTNTSCK